MFRAFSVWLRPTAWRVQVQSLGSHCGINKIPVSLLYNPDLDVSLELSVENASPDNNIVVLVQYLLLSTIVEYLRRHQVWQRFDCIPSANWNRFRHSASAVTLILLSKFRDITK